METNLHSLSQRFAGSRRDWLRATLGAAVGISASGWFDARSGEGRPRQTPQAFVHLAVDVRRPEPDRYVRPEGRPRQRWSVQADPDLRARLGDLRTHAAAGTRRRSIGAGPFDEHQGRGPFAGHVPVAHRLHAGRASRLSGARRWSVNLSARRRPSCRTASASAR